MSSGAAAIETNFVVVSAEKLTKLKFDFKLRRRRRLYWPVHDLPTTNDCPMDIHKSQNNVQATLANVTITTAVIPYKAWPSTPAYKAALWLPEAVDVLDDPLKVPDPVGTKVAAGLEIQELAAAFAAEIEVGAFGLTVPLPAKLQA